MSIIQLQRIYIGEPGILQLKLIWQDDFRKIGYCADWKKIPVPTESILFADSCSIRYLTDVDKDGTIDTVYYHLDYYTDIPETPNPRDRYLYRIVNSQIPTESNLGITQFKMEFFNALGAKLSFPISDPREIYSMQIDISVEDIAAYNEEYQTVFWRQIRMAARNLFNR